jgi:hypothetical protein
MSLITHTLLIPMSVEQGHFIGRCFHERGLTPESPGGRSRSGDRIRIGRRVRRGVLPEWCRQVPNPQA